MAMPTHSSEPAWSFTNHLRRRAAERGVTHAALLQVLTHPEVTYSQSTYGPARHVYQRGGVGVIVHLPTRTVITVVFRHGERWSRNLADAGMAA